MECQYCKNTFKNRWSLLNHQKTTKYCLNLQNKKVTKTDNFKCQFCGLFLSTKQRLNSHIYSCNANTQHVKDLINTYEKTIYIKDKEINELKTQLQIYKELSERELSCVENIARQPRTQNNNIQNNFIINIFIQERIFLRDKYHRYDY